MKVWVVTAATDPSNSWVVGVADSFERAKRLVSEREGGAELRWSRLPDETCCEVGHTGYFFEEYEVAS